MFTKLFRHLPAPRSLRGQFIVAFAALELLVVASGLVAFNALRQSAESTQQLAGERLVRLQDAQDLVQRTLLIEHEAERMLEASSLDQMRAAYDEINQQMETLDRLVEILGASSADVSVLALHQSGQLFRNTAHVIAGLREEALQAQQRNSQTAQGDPATPGTPAGSDPAERLNRFHDTLHRQAVAMARAAQELSTQCTREYQAAVQKVATASTENQQLVLGLFIASLLLGWLVYRYFLNRHVLARLEEVSLYLRRGDIGTERLIVPVYGGDEIGEMARAVEQFLEDRRGLAVANTELEAFSYSVSHDLQAPLRAIDGFSRILLKTYHDQLDAEARDYLETIHKNAMRMRDLINDILEFSRMSRHRIAAEEIDLGSLAQEVFEEARATDPKRSITLRLGDLRPAKGDRSLIRQVLVNLLSNAVKFTAQQPEALIQFECLEKGELNTYHVKDNGIGFDMQYAGELFGVFQRMYGSEKFEGTGIGLAIVKRIILRHGGRVWADSKPGEGAEFFFTLPSVPKSS